MIKYKNEIESVTPSIYFSHDAGIWRHVSDLFKPEWFKLLMKGDGSKSIETIQQWGEWLAKSKNYGKFQGQNCGRVVFEKLASEGKLPKIEKGELSSNGIDQYVDYITNSGERLQLKHSLGQYVPNDVINGKYTLGNGVDGVAVNSESYKQIIENPARCGFCETSPGSGIAIKGLGSDSTRLIDSGLDSSTSRDILTKAQDHAKENLKPLNISEHLFENSLKAAGIAALMTFVFKGSINLYKVFKGKMRSDDAVDNTIGCSLKASITGGITTFITGSTMAIIGIPTFGMGLTVAIPIGVATGLIVSKAVNSSLDMIYNNLMGGQCIQLARQHNSTLEILFDNMEKYFQIADEQQTKLENKVKGIMPINFQKYNDTIAEVEKFLQKKKGVIQS